MTLSNINFDNVSERDLLEQIAAGAPEGVLLDYKREMYGRGDADVKEFLKDVSSFANTAGGHLIIGVDEAAGIPTGITALNDDADQDLQRLENLTRDGVEPRIAGLRMKALPISTGGYVVILRIPKSWNPPLACTRFRRHRVRCFDGAGGGSWRDGSLPASSSLRRCG